MELVRLTVKSELPALGSVKEIFSHGQTICVVNVAGELYAMANICPHWGGPLGRGTIENGKLRCPWHGWEFDPKTGKTPRRPEVCVPTYKLSIEGEYVFLELETLGQP